MPRRTTQLDLPVGRRRARSEVSDVTEVTDVTDGGPA
jgi:hypothetical protein